MKTAAALFLALALIPIVTPAAQAPAAQTPAPAASSATQSQPAAKPDLAQQIGQAVRNLEVQGAVTEQLLEHVSAQLYAPLCQPHGGLATPGNPIQFKSADGKTFAAAVTCHDGSVLNEKVP